MIGFRTAKKQGLVGYLVTANQIRLQLDEVTTQFKLKFVNEDFMSRSVIALACVSVPEHYFATAAHIATIAGSSLWKERRLQHVAEFQRICWMSSKSTGNVPTVERFIGKAPSSKQPRKL